MPKETLAERPSGQSSSHQEITRTPGVEASHSSDQVRQIAKDQDINIFELSERSSGELPHRSQEQQDSHKEQERMRETDRSMEDDFAGVCELSAQNIEEILAFEQKHAPKEPLYAKATIEDLKHVFSHPDTCKMYGSYKGKELVALGAYQTQGDAYSSRKLGVYEICGIVVHSEHWGKGLGRQIVNHVCDRIRSTQKYTEIYLTVSPENEDALKFYSKLGFSQIDYKENVYGEGGHQIYMSPPESSLPEMS